MRLSWRRHAVPAVAIDGTVGIGEYEEHKRQLPRRKDESNSQLQQSPQRIPKSRNSVELHLESRKCSDFDFTTDDYVDSIPPPQYSQIPVPPKRVMPKSTVRHVPASPPRRNQSAPTPPPGTVRDVSSAPDYNPALQSFLNVKPGQSTMSGRPRKASCSSTSTIFERSPTIPISIVVTTPDEETPPNSNPSSNGSYFPSASEIRRFRNDSTMSLPSISSGSLAAPPQIPDRTRLMPPLDTQVDARKLRKAQEFEEIRHFLIGFLNSKGDQFPRKLRLRIMSIYGIRDGDLDPRTVAKFDMYGGEVHDEGVVLEHALLPGEPGDRDHLRILEMAFQSIIPVVTPQPHPAHEILAARRKRMSVPFHSITLQTVVEPSPIAKRMSLSSHTKSKTMLDSIINNRSALMNKRASAPPPLKRSSTTTSLPSKLNPKYQSNGAESRHKALPPSKSIMTQRPSSRSSIMSAPPTSKTYIKSLPIPIQSHQKISTVAQPKPTIQPSLSSKTAATPTASKGHSKSRPLIPDTTNNRSLFPATSKPTPLPPLKNRITIAPPAVQTKSHSHPKSRPLIVNTNPQSSVPAAPSTTPQPTLRRKAAIIPAAFQTASQSHPKSGSLTASTDISTSLSASIKPNRAPLPPPSPPSTPNNEDDDNYLPPSWMAPLISISPTDQSFATEEDFLNTIPKPNPIGTPGEIMFPSHPAVAPLNGRNWLKLDQKQLQIIESERKANRGGLFGMMKNAFGGSRSEKKKK